MTIQHSGQNESGAAYGRARNETASAGTDTSFGQNAGRAGEASHQYGGDGPDFGSARSDYGRYAFGGHLNEQGLESESRNSSARLKRTASLSGSRRAGSSVSRMLKRYKEERQGKDNKGRGFSTGLLLIGGAGVGAALMYLLDPEQGRRRRALVRDQIVKAKNKTADAVGKTSRDLRNRAQGVIAETRSALRSENQPKQTEEAASGLSTQTRSESLAS